MSIFLLSIGVVMLIYLLVEDFRTIALAIASFYTLILCMTFCINPSIVPTSSMAITAARGEFVLIQKKYGTVLYSTPIGLWFRFGILAPLIQINAPKRGDIVTFIANIRSRMEFLKRVVAIEGDKIQFKNGKLILNDVEAEYKFLESIIYYNDYEQRYEYDIYEESINGHSRKIMVTRPQNSKDSKNFEYNDNTLPIIVPKGHLYIVGDNRRGSSDSRHYFGTIPVENVTGKAIVSICKGYHFAPYANNDDLESAYNLNFITIFMTIIYLIAGLVSSICLEFNNIGCLLV